MNGFLTTIAAFFASVLAIFGMGSQEASNITPTPTQVVTAAPTNSNTQQVVYKGVSPCADCSGINTTLTLNYDGSNNTSGTYTMVMVYQGKSVQPVTETGTWSGGSNDIITLTPSGANSQPQYFKQTNAYTLEGLDGDQQPLPASVSYTLSANN